MANDTNKDYTLWDFLKEFFAALGFGSQEGKATQKQTAQQASDLFAQTLPRYSEYGKEQTYENFKKMLSEDFKNDVGVRADFWRRIEALPDEYKNSSYMQTMLEHLRRYEYEVNPELNPNIKAQNVADMKAAQRENDMASAVTEEADNKSLLAGMKQSDKPYEVHYGSLAAANFDSMMDAAEGQSQGITR